MSSPPRRDLLFCFYSDFGRCWIPGKINSEDVEKKKTLLRKKGKESSISEKETKQSHPKARTRDHNCTELNSKLVDLTKLNNNFAFFMKNNQSKFHFISPKWDDIGKQQRPQEWKEMKLIPINFFKRNELGKRKLCSAQLSGDSSSSHWVILIPSNPFPPPSSPIKRKGPVQWSQRRKHHHPRGGGRRKGAPPKKRRDEEGPQHQLNWT